MCDGKEKRITTIKEAQQLVKVFAERDKWKDTPNEDKFDHLHEELAEMSQLLRYKDEPKSIRTIVEKSDVFVDGIGDLLFALCRLANQLGVYMEDAFNMVQKEILAKYTQKQVENKTVNVAAY